MENYEKKYKEALERATTLYENANGMILKKWVEQVFPELKESEDEKIKNRIIKLIKMSSDVGGFALHKWEADEMLTWLEKQGEQKPQGKSALEAITEEKVDNSNKIENPKFHEGDWIVQGCNILKIKCVGNTHYCYETVGGYVDDMLVSEIDSLYHLWTIQDAKDGDVLAEDSCIFIIQKLGDNSTAAKTYCTLYNDGDFEDGAILYFDIDSTKPATTEQIDILFQKMNEAGYEWDNEKKELRKIEHKIAESEDEVIRKRLINICQDAIAACTNDQCTRRLSCLRWWLGTNKDPYLTHVVTDASECELYVERQ